ncbi:MAG: pseudouridine synthase [Candidatus Adiutrix sp.]|jgi:hypothetical protein|nr:pseudouridine synthase [Candidatus Adiutrix sp.]
MWAKVKKYLWDIALAFDQLLNAFLGGYPDETFSARVHRKAEAGQWVWKLLRRLIDLLFWRDCTLGENGKRVKGHCQLSYESERERRHCPAELRGGLPGDQRPAD